LAILAKDCVVIVVSVIQCYLIYKTVLDI